MKRRTARLAVAAAAALAVAAAPWTWLPALAGAVARHWLDLGEKGSSAIEVRELSPFRLRFRNLVFGAIPGAPAVGSVEARYTPWGLVRGRVASVAADGFLWDLSALVPEKAAAHLPGTNATGRLVLGWKPGRGYEGRLSADVLGAPLEADFSSDAPLRAFALRARLAPAPGAASPLPAFVLSADARRPEGADATNALAATARLSVDGSPLAAVATATAGDGATACTIDIPSAGLSRDDALLAALLAPLLKPDAPPFGFSGAVEGKVEMSRPKRAPLPVWTARFRAKDFVFSAEAGGKPAVAEGCDALFAFDGLGSHVDVLPFGIRFRRAAFDRYALDNGALWFRADTRSLLLTEGVAGFCGGKVRVYALHLNFEKLDAGFTLLLDDLDAGEVLALFPQIAGTATGRMNGKLPLSIRQGAKVRLRDAFLHSPPGQVGKLRLERAQFLVDRLRQSGIPSETCSALEDALRDLDYDVLRLDLSQDYKSGEGRLAVRLHGKAAASAGRAATPVDLNVVFNGQLEESINIGLRAAGIQPRGR